jgi:hypothetical protein
MQIAFLCNDFHQARKSGFVTPIPAFRMPATGIAMTTIRVARHRAKIEPSSIELVATDKRKPTLLSERWSAVG